MVGALLISSLCFTAYTMPQKLFFHLFNINIITIKINIPLITLTNFSERGSRERCLHWALVTFPPPGHTATCCRVALPLAIPWGAVLIEVKKDLLVPFSGTWMAVSSLNPPPPLGVVDVLLESSSLRFL